MMFPNVAEARFSEEEVKAAELLDVLRNSTDRLLKANSNAVTAVSGPGTVTGNGIITSGGSVGAGINGSGGAVVSLVDSNPGSIGVSVTTSDNPMSAKVTSTYNGEVISNTDSIGRSDRAGNVNDNENGNGNENQSGTHSAGGSSQPSTLLDMVYNNSIINSVVDYYEGNTNSSGTKRAASLNSVGGTSTNSDIDATMTDVGSETEYKGAIEASNYNFDKRTTNVCAGRVSKRQKITEALARSRDNLKQYKLGMSIESKKKIITCLHLLKLANKQLTDKVSSLQNAVQHEELIARKKKDSNCDRRKKKRLPLDSDVKQVEYNPLSIKNITLPEDYDELDNQKRETSIGLDNNKDDEDTISAQTDDEEEDEEDDEFFDAVETNNEQSAVIKMEVVTTVKKVFSVISKFAGGSLPEPARSQVRNSLLTLPENWTATANNSTLGAIDCTCCDSDYCLSANCKVLILAKESLDMMKNVMHVLDSSLGKAEEWIKQRQEWKEELRERLMRKQEYFAAQRLLRDQNNNRN
ncbi:hypothetical protein Kpol_460p21 [Vanderwaltozyma polyspora DSM 70294]|uniref:Uncharacterized protein n=1 Tax=Vanderwaltozyma polyspora (strain ATCC 22028 / DSM 70294 / BCRC 21397 / CBS 2163 / NBRC 10782 / NRRL Y-8283 / UCD 57-17) TaxID=436907 RepID=A7TQT7_VANPO|nr:uncharacterized protein Kpol_460p21 [Vanderwaltozyma polyspora DSM 70294]EDO15386.1 hypothetical protein Kpol_460p21 [Vanderwaltozyma polyspora DSM 70294]